MEEPEMNFITNAKVMILKKDRSNDYEGTFVGYCALRLAELKPNLGMVKTYIPYASILKSDGSIKWVLLDLVKPLDGEVEFEIAARKMAEKIAGGSVHRRLTQEQEKTKSED